jgi:polysaccharide pyruvyl transferase WcaK-like protein
MTSAIQKFLATTDLEQSLLVGYYGGGNFGDELLLETLSASLHQRGTQQLEVAYQDPPNFDVHHHDYGYQRVATGDKGQFLGAIRRSRNIIIGGGGLWGLDINANVFLLSALLFLSRWLLGKKVYLVGVGYYGSTSKLGHAAAWLAGKAANHIIARDDETAANFRKISLHVSQDEDIAWQIPDLQLDDYRKEIDDLDKRLHVKDKALFIAIRRFKPSQRNDYNATIADILAANQNRPIIVSLMEPRDVDPEGYAQLQRWQEQYPKLTVADFNYNPFALYGWFCKHHDQLALIAPQFHLIVLALLTKTAFLPVSYDNKVSQLLQRHSHSDLPIGQLDAGTIQTFIDDFYKHQPH